jgi:hypothetical protein
MGDERRNTMRKILFTLLAVGAMLAAIPAASLAHGGDHPRGDRHREREHQREHRHARDHDRIRHERFGGQDGLRHDAGTVSSFASGQLTIRLNDGSSVTAAINRFTEVECETPEFMRPADHGPDGSGSGSSGGPGDDTGQGQCTMIKPGMVVRDATLTLTGFGAVWTRVDLIDS